tara:strand:+ start:278 stop:1252 length:975 start_codon:yes stop_codon:yes gene_type:complete
MEKLIYKDILLIIISIISTFFIYKKSIPLFGKYFVDIPNLRSLHKYKSPTGGGIIFAILISIFSLFKSNYIPIICLPISIIGLIDDKINLSQKFRIVSQLITSIMLLIAGFYFGNILPWIDSKLIFILMIPIICSCIGVINFLNFSDGINGLLAGSMTIYFIYYSFNISNDFIFIIPTISVFLFFNWSPAKIFMGDSGSLFLGAIYVSTLLRSNTFNEFFVLIIMMSPILLDVLTVLLRRLFYKHNIFKAHRLHLYQRLVSSGYTHSQVSSIYIFFTLTFSLLAIYGDLKLLFILFLLMIFLGLYLDQNVAYPFKKMLLQNNNY